LFTLAESLGGVECLVCHPGTMTHAAMTKEVQREAGIKTTLLRLSVGIEHLPDLISYVSIALDRTQKMSAVALTIASYA